MYCCVYTLFRAPGTHTHARTHAHTYARTDARMDARDTHYYYYYYYYYYDYYYYYYYYYYISAHIRLLGQRLQLEFWEQISSSV